MKVAIYARVSDDRMTEEGYRRQDVQRQVDKITAFCANSGVVIPPDRIYIDDAKSAYKDDYGSRPAFLRLLRDIKANWVDRVYVEDLTRWSRRLDVGLQDMKTAAEHNCTITSLQEGEINVTITEGWMRAAIGLMMAEWAARSMADKVKSGMKRREDDKRKICNSCGVVHLGRHPLTCQCLKCLKSRS